MALAGCLFTLVVMSLGAFARLVDAGLGCPDWPGCYGHIIVPNTATSVNKIAATFPSSPFVAQKAWAEMVHRYFAGSLGLFMLGVTFMGIKTARMQGRQKLIPFYLGLIALLAYQITLGKLTVTWKLLPLIVTQHLLGGMLILSSLWFAYLINRTHVQSTHVPWGVRVLALFGLVLLFTQIALGAWTSTNYAAFSCPDFPFCSVAHPLNHWSWAAAFDLTHPVGINYQGGVLDDSVRATIQMVHRVGALVVVCFFLTFAIVLNVRSDTPSHLKAPSLWVLLALAWQIMLGISNVIYRLPLPVAILHNVSAGLLLMSVIYLNVSCYYKKGPTT
jgi:cytochrome c oxidase assembly protein subunit 15